MPRDLDTRVPVRRALISVSDKTGAVELARALQRAGAEILSTGSTAKELRESGISVVDVSEHTGFPEIMGGRVKTLHPRIHGGLLGRRGMDDRIMDANDIPPIDLLAVNLYPFEETVAEPDCPLAEAIEQIDIGGPAMLRAAAKNHDHVAVLTDPSQYPAAIEALESEGGLDGALRFRLAVEAFNLVARYDDAVSGFLSSVNTEGERSDFPGQLNASFTRALQLRYGENPHQKAAFYRELRPAKGTLATFTQLQGKELSYNNIADADTAWECARGFGVPACVIVKHANPCGVARAEDLTNAYQKAFACDPSSAFGGIIAFNRPLDGETARRVLDNQFAEILIAPSVSAEALQAAESKKDLRLLEIPAGMDSNELEVRSVGGGLLVQTTDTRPDEAGELNVVSRATATPEVVEELLFAWRVARYVKSNAIVCARDGQTLGIGAGQTSRVMSVSLAVQKARDAGLSLEESVLASDAFFPFRDGIDAAAKAGVRAVIQPAGSIRDDEIVAAADEHGMILVFAPRRHFRH